MPESQRRPWEGQDIQPLSWDAHPTGGDRAAVGPAQGAGQGEGRGAELWSCVRPQCGREDRVQEGREPAPARRDLGLSCLLGLPERGSALPAGSSLRKGTAPAPLSHLIRLLTDEKGRRALAQPSGEASQSRGLRSSYPATPGLRAPVCPRCLGCSSHLPASSPAFTETIQQSSSDQLKRRGRTEARATVHTQGTRPGRRTLLRGLRRPGDTGGGELGVWPLRARPQDTEPPGDSRTHQVYFTRFHRGRRRTKPGRGRKDSGSQQGTKGGTHAHWRRE